MKSLKLTVVASIGGSSCLGGKCPSIFITEDGRCFVQGLKTPKELESDLSGSESECLVEIPADLIRQAAAKL